jgi:hypothetical protein
MVFSEAEGSGWYGGVVGCWLMVLDRPMNTTVRRVEEAIKETESHV